MVEDDEKYDLIISNPPFYTDDFKTRDVSRNTARFTTSLSFKELLNGVSKLLHTNGVFAVIIPFKEEANLVGLAEKENLYPIRICRVKGAPATAIKRSLVEFSFAKSETQQEELIIETTRHEYTQAYIELTKDFYMKM